MTHFPLTESLGIKIRKPTIGNIVAESFDYVLVRDLEAVLEKGVNIQPIQRMVKRVEIEAAKNESEELRGLLDRILNYGVEP